MPHHIRIPGMQVNLTTVLLIVLPKLEFVWLQIRKEPKEVQMERQQQAAEANRLQRKEQQEKNDAKKKMKGKNKPSKKHKKKQINVIEEKKGRVRQELQQQQANSNAELGTDPPEHVPSALQRFYKRT